MKKFLIVIAAVALFSCKKDETANDPNVKVFESFQNKYLVCDSVKTTSNGITTKQVLGKGKGQDITFSTYGDYTIYSNPPVVGNYALELPNKIYFWQETYNPDQFYKIVSMAGSKLVLQENVGSSRVYVRYYTKED